MKEGITGKRKWFRETFEGWSRHNDTGTDRYIRREINREEDTYSEVVKTTDGDVVRECIEPLSQHRGRGSAKAALKSVPN